MPTVAPGSRLQVQYILETTYGALPAALGAAVQLRRQTANTLELAAATLKSAELRPDRQIEDYRLGIQTVPGDLDEEITYGTPFNDFLQAVLGGTWTGAGPFVLKAGTIKRTFDVEKGNKLIGQYQLYLGTAINKLQLTVKTGELVKAKWSVMGRTMQILYPTYQDASLNAAESYSSGYEPFAYWRLNGGTTAQADSGEFNLPLTMSGTGVTYGVTSPLVRPSGGAAAVTLDGVAGQGNTPSNPALNFGDTISIAFWWKRTATQSAIQYVLSKGATAYAVFFDAANKLNFEKNGTGSIFVSTAAITDQNWHFYVITKSGSTTVVYQDNVVLAGTVTNQTLANSAVQLSVGSNQGASFAPGSMAELALYNTALIVADVNFLWQASQAPTISITSTPAPTTHPITALIGTFKEGGSNIAYMQSLDLTIDNGIKNADVLGTNLAYDFFEGYSDLQGTAGFWFPDATIAAKFIAETESSIEFVLTDLAGNTLDFLLPRIKYTSWGVPVQNAGGITQTAKFQGLYDTITNLSNIVVTRNN